MSIPITTGNNQSTVDYQLAGVNCPPQPAGLPPAIIIPSLFQLFSGVAEPLRQVECEKSFASLKATLSGRAFTDSKDNECYLGFRNTITYTPRDKGCVFAFDSKDYGQGTLTHTENGAVVTFGSDPAKTFATNFQNYFDIKTDGVQVRLKQDLCNPNLFTLDVSLKDRGSFSASCVEGKTTACTFKGMDNSEHTLTASTLYNHLNLEYKGPNGASGIFDCSMDSVEKYSAGKCTGELKTGSGGLKKLSSTKLSAKIERNQMTEGVEVYTLDLKHKPWLSHLVFGGDRDLGKVTITLNKNDGTVEVSGNFNALGYETTDNLLKLFAKCTRRPNNEGFTCNGDLSGKNITPLSFQVGTKTTQDTDQNRFTYNHNLKTDLTQHLVTIDASKDPLYTRLHVSRSFDDYQNFSSVLEFGGLLNRTSLNNSTSSGSLYFQTKNSAPRTQI